MTEPGGLQFDKAEPREPSAPGGVSCLACKKPVLDAYFTLNARILCPACKSLLETHQASGSSAGRVLKAFLFGLGAALIGTLIFALMLQKHVYIALVAILVGFLVGKAVRAGSGGRGGRGYQVMAVLLTYSSIVSGYIPTILEGVKQHSPRSTAPAAKPGENPGAPGEAPPSAVQSPGKPTDGTQEFKPGCFNVVVALLVLFAIACASPWLAGFENVLGWIIIAVALIEALRLTRAMPLAFNGPFRVGGPPTSPEAPRLA
ncbi:MAG TPA: hypothetical protein VEN81_01215 [Planctomycetota bacterium]|nr:hypothetical protein [Planctomycetota bacterium]